MEKENLHELFIEELQDLYHAEKQLLKALPKMAKAATSDQLRQAFQTHVQETEEQVNRLEQVFDLLDRPAKAKKCQAMEGLVDEAKDLISDHDESPALDAALICAAQKVEHYEIAAYGTLCTWGELMGHMQVLQLLKQTLSEEKQTDEKLTQIAESTINLEANEGGEGMEGDIESSGRSTASAGRSSRQTVGSGSTRSRSTLARKS